LHYTTAVYSAWTMDLLQIEVKLPKIDITWVIVAFIVMFAVLRQCEAEPKIKVETKEVVKWKTDTIVDVQIKEIPKTVYVEKVKTVKGDEIIIYKDKPSETTTETKKYETTLKADSAVANLTITADKLYDVQGTIDYPRIEKTTTITKIKDKSGFYLYGQVPITDFTNPEIGVQFNVINTFFISSGIQYNQITKQPDINVGVGIKIF
jgi:hypothetical protein